MAERLDAATVVRAAAALANESGLDSVTMTAVAERVGVRTPSLYGHVRDRQALLDQVSLLALSQLSDRLADGLAGRSGRDALERFATINRETARTEPGSWAALHRPIPPELAATSAGGRIVALTHAVLHGYALPATELVHAVRVLGATVTGFIELEASGGFAHSAPSPDRSWDRMIDALDSLLTHWPTP